jgi:PilZ domain
MLHKSCSFFRDSGTLSIGQGIGYCDLDSRQTVCDGDLSFCEKPSDLRNHQNQERGKNRRDRRNHPRFDLDLPVEYQALGTLKAFGGIAIDGSEEGLRIFSTKEVFVGAKLKILVLFPAGYRLDSLEVVAEVARRKACLRGGKGYEYGLRIVGIGEEDLKKLRRLLSGRMAQEEASREFLLEFSSEA